MIIGILDEVIQSLPITNQEAYLYALTNDDLVVGSIQMSDFDGTIAVWGDDDIGTPDIIDGALPLSKISLQLVNSNVLYDLIIDEIIYSNNSIVVIESASIISVR